MLDTGYPITLELYRDIGKDFNGVIHVWDVDKTYLDTPFSSIRGLARIPVEFSVDKRPIKGMPEVIQELRWGSSDDYQGVPVVFITASPSWMSDILKKRMTMDGVEYDGLIMKDWIKIIFKKEFFRLKGQLGFKLISLLLLHSLFPVATLILYGDDMESDPEAFDMYIRIASHKLFGAALEDELDRYKVHHKDKKIIHDLAELTLINKKRTPKQNKAFILIQKGRPVSTLPSSVEPVKDALHLARLLYKHGFIRQKALTKVTHSLTD